MIYQAKKLGPTVMVFHRFYIRGFFVHYTLYNLKLDMHRFESYVPKKGGNLGDAKREKIDNAK